MKHVVPFASRFVGWPHSVYFTQSVKVAIVATTKGIKSNGIFNVDVVCDVKENFSKNKTILPLQIRFNWFRMN